jgi:hypothetical protein
MASEKKLEQVLDLLTKAPPSKVEALAMEAWDDTRSMRRVLGSKNVIGVGISEKILRRKSTGKLALTFYVEKKIPLKDLSADEAIPPTVPEALSGPEAIQTDVVALGKLVPEINATRKPLQPGNSIGHIEIGAGTLGAIVSKGQSYYLLSNSHVLALCGTAKKGDTIIYPGEADGGKTPEDLVAKLSDFKQFVGGGDFVNHVDCAIAKPVAARLSDLTSEIKGVGIPRGAIKAKRGMKVVKVGRTTGKTAGEVRDVNFRFALDYEKEGLSEVGFVDQVLCTRFTKPGDSGSLVIDQKSGKAVGLHFAGASGGSVFNPIADVLNALGVQLVTKPIVAAQAKASRKKTTTKASSTKKPARRKTTGRKTTNRS